MAMRKRISIAWVAVGVVVANVVPMFVLSRSGGRVAAFTPVVIIGIFVVLEGFFLRSDYVARWSKAHGIVLTPENETILFPYLRRGRAIRATGGFVGYATYAVWTVSLERTSGASAWIAATFAGYLLGAAAAEFWAFRARPMTRLAASLSPRQISTYVPRLAVILMRGATLTIVALAIAWPYIPHGHPQLRSGRAAARPELAETLAWTGIAIAISILVEATARRIVRRPQPAVSDTFVEADDAIRSTAMHGVIGSGLALQLGILSRQAGQWTSFGAGGHWKALLSLLSVLAGIAAVFAWLSLGIDQKFVVRRSSGHEVAA